MGDATVRGRLGKVGIWSLELRFGDPGAAVAATAELDALGYGAIWIPGGVGGDVFGDVGRLLDASQSATIATGILNIWKHAPAEVGGWWAGLDPALHDRLLLGLGISHAPLIGDGWDKPVARMREYLDGLDAEGVPAERLCLAALGPKMVALSRDRTAGAHPYLVTPEHSAIARAILGPDALLAPEQGVVLETDPERARGLARKAVDHYRALPNYVNSWKRLGIAEEDIIASSDRFIDALFAWGDEAAIAARVQAHLDAGADHVCLQVIRDTAAPDATALLPAWRRLAAALL